MKNLIKFPLTTIQGVLIALVGVITYYKLITIEEGSLWIALILAVYKLFSNDDNYNSGVSSKKGKGAITPETGP